MFWFNVSLVVIGIGVFTAGAIAFTCLFLVRNNKGPDSF